MDYQQQAQRRLADERLRALVGERLSNLPGSALEQLSPHDRNCYERLLLRCEFFNQPAFQAFDNDASAERIAHLQAADAALTAAASALDGISGDQLPSILQRVEAAFNERDAVMMKG